jgi:hypothetical protein
MKAVVTQQVRRFPSFLEPECLLPFSEVLASGFCPEPNKCHHISFSFPNIHFSIVLVFKEVSSPKMYKIMFSAMQATYASPLFG